MIFSLSRSNFYLECIYKKSSIYIFYLLYLLYNTLYHNCNNARFPKLYIVTRDEKRSFLNKNLGPHTRIYKARKRESEIAASTSLFSVIFGANYSNVAHARSIDDDVSTLLILLFPWLCLFDKKLWAFPLLLRTKRTFVVASSII